MMKTFYPESRFGGFTDVDGTIAFYTRVNSLLRSTFRVLDVGCGRAAYAEDCVTLRRNLRVLRGKCNQVMGIDVDPQASANPFLDEFRLIDGERWPVDDHSVEMCICDYVLEHVANPAHFFSEFRRVLKPGGYLCIRAPNLLSYFGVISSLVPDRLQSAVARSVQTHREDGDVFPTLYRCNTVWKIRRFLDENDFEHCVYG